MILSVFKIRKKNVIVKKKTLYVRLCGNCGDKLCVRLFGADSNGNYKKQRADTGTNA